MSKNLTIAEAKELLREGLVNYRDSHSIAALLDSFAALATPADTRLLAENQRLRQQTIRAFLKRQIPWSREKFGAGPRVGGIIKHIEKELDEIRAKPTDATEWIDVAILALDGAWRAGYTAEQLEAALFAKQAENMARKWPPPTDDDTPNEHIRVVAGPLTQAEIDDAEIRGIPPACGCQDECTICREKARTADLLDTEGPE